MHILTVVASKVERYSALIEGYIIRDTDNRDIHIPFVSHELHLSKSASAQNTNNIEGLTRIENKISNIII